MTLFFGFLSSFLVNARDITHVVGLAKLPDRPANQL
jgi:hypothetical protein